MAVSLSSATSLDAGCVAIESPTCCCLSYRRSHHASAHTEGSLMGYIRVKGGRTDADFSRVGQQIAYALVTTVKETRDLDLDTAAGTFQERLAAIGYNIQLDWCREGIEKTRNGERFPIHLR